MQTHCVPAGSGLVGRLFVILGGCRLVVEQCGISAIPIILLDKIRLVFCTFWRIIVGNVVCGGLCGWWVCGFVCDMLWWNRDADGLW